MKNVTIKSRLFAENGINQRSAFQITGGLSNWTQKDSDTSSKSSYDVEKITKDENGQNGVVDTFDTGATNTDRPVA